MTRFAFYGRVSTEDQQDPKSSRNWQLTRSRQLIEPSGGEVVSEFFDVGQSRSIPWPRRPEAARLLKAIAEPGRGFDAVVVGEPQRAFYGNQFGLTFPVFVHYGVELWVPEVGGAIDPGSDAHEIVMSLYGGMSKGERNRIRTRVRSAMASQAALEGRYLGGRPPYGYQLADAGPHPNPGKAAVGQRLHRLEPDPIAAPVVRRIFEMFIDGAGLGTIAQALTDDGIPSPSAHDPKRNRHRTKGQGLWARSAVRAILTNPRYTGHQVWNRQRREETLIDVQDVALGHQTRMRWNGATDWVWSQEQTHEAIVDVDLFEAAQDAARAKGRATGRRSNEDRRYVLSGLVHCGACNRRMAGHWTNGRAYYRCRFPVEYAVPEENHPRTIYVREDAIVPGLDRWLASLFEPDQIESTCEALAEAGEPDPEAARREEELRERLAECDRTLDAYRSVVRDQPETAAEVGKWIAETLQERKRLERQLHRTDDGTKLTKDDIRALVASLKDIVGVLAAANQADKAEVYAELGISLTYHQDNRVTVESRPRVLPVRVGGGT